MSKPAVFLLALAIGASACAPAAPEQSIVAVVDPSAAPADADTKTESSSTETTQVPGTETTEVPGTEVPELPAETTVAPVEPKETAVEELLAFTVDPDAQHSSARFSGGIEMVGNVEGDAVDIEMSFDGAYNLNRRSMEMTLDMSSMASMFGLGGDEGPEAEMFAEVFAEPMQMKTIGDTAWVKWGLLDMFTGSPGMWVETEAEEGNFGGSAGSPADLLDMLRGASGAVTEVGSESIRGVETTHYRILLDLEEYSDELSAAEVDEIRSMVGEIGEMPLDVWVDADGLLRRLEMNMSADNFGGGMSPTDNFAASMWYELYDYETDIEIAPPPADQVVSGTDIGTF